MEHFECTNTKCNAYMRDNKCMWRYGDNIHIDYKTCPHIVELLSKEKHCDVNGWKRENGLK